MKAIRVNEIRRAGPVLSTMGVGDVTVNPAWHALTKMQFPKENDDPTTWPSVRDDVSLGDEKRRFDVAKFLGRVLDCSSHEVRSVSIELTSSALDAEAFSLRRQREKAWLSLSENDGSTTIVEAQYDTSAGVAFVRFRNDLRGFHASWHALRGPSSEIKHNKRT